MQLEQQRLDFIEKRDGKEQALAFAKRTLAIYRTSLSRTFKEGKPGFARDKQFRRSFVVSCLDLREYLRKNNCYF